MLCQRFLRRQNTYFEHDLAIYYRLTTVPSLEDAIAAGQYITHTGACGTCSSLQDLALMIEYPSLPYKAHQCFFRSSAVQNMEEAITCYEEIGFTQTCSNTLAYYQKKIVEKSCGYQCATWAYDGDLGNREYDIAKYSVFIHLIENLPR